MNKPYGYYEQIPEMIPESVTMFEAEVYKSPKSVTGFRAYPIGKNGKVSIHGKELMLDDAIYLRQNNEHDFTKKGIKAMVYECPITDKNGEIIETRYKIHEIIR